MHFGFRLSKNFHFKKHNLYFVIQYRIKGKIVFNLPYSNDSWYAWLSSAAEVRHSPLWHYQPSYFLRSVTYKPTILQLSKHTSSTVLQVTPLTSPFTTVDIRLHSPPSNLRPPHLNRCSEWRLLASPSHRRNRVHCIRNIIHVRNTTQMVYTCLESTWLAYRGLEFSRCKSLLLLVWQLMKG